MPGENCSIPGCGVCRNQKKWSLFKIQTVKDEQTRQWREEVLKTILSSRELDGPLRKRIQNDKVYVCERHYDDPDKVVQCK